MSNKDFEKFVELLKKKEDVFSLIKVKSKRNGQVPTGDNVVGSLTLLNNLGTVMVLVSTTGSDYIRTSPIVKIVKCSKNEIEFETEGGFYLLTKISNKKVV